MSETNSQNENDEKPSENIESPDNVELEDLLNDALQDFNTETSTQTISDENTTNTKSTGTNVATKKLNSFLPTDKAANTNIPASGQLPASIKLESGTQFIPVTSFPTADLNHENVDKLINELQQQMNALVGSNPCLAGLKNPQVIFSSYPPQNNTDSILESVVEEIKEKLGKISLDTQANKGASNQGGESNINVTPDSNTDANTPNNKGLSNEGGESNTNVTPDSNTNANLNLQNIISQAISNLSENCKGLDGDKLMNSQEETEEFINYLKLKNDYTEVETQFIKMFIDLCKTLMYAPLKEIIKTYPTYLEDNKLNLPKETYENYEKQYLTVVKMCNIFEDEDSETKNNAFQNILKILQEIQTNGLPPEELVEKYPCYEIFKSMATVI